MQVPPGEGYDHNFCVTRNWQTGCLFVGKVSHAKSGRVLEVYSDQPGLQFYTGGRVPFHYDPEVSPGQNDWLQRITEEDKGAEECYENGEEGEEEMYDRGQWEDLAKPQPLEFLSGKKGARYKKHCAFGIQPQNYPNAPNYQHFPCSILYPGQVYCHDLAYKFGVQLANYM